jgi:ABC-type amino acid transport substrate-binding protein
MSPREILEPGRAMRRKLTSVLLAAFACVPPALAADDPRILRVGIDTRTPPWAFVPGLDFSKEDQFAAPKVTDAQLATAQGFEVELVQALAHRLGMKARLVPASWYRLEQGLKNAQFDVILSSWTPNPKTPPDVAASISYCDWGLVLTVRAGETRIHSPADLEGRRVGHMRDPAVSSALREMGGGSFIQEEDADKLFAELKAGALDAVLFDSFYARWKISQDPAFRIVGEPLNRLGYHVGVLKSDARLLERVDAAIRGLLASGGAGRDAAAMGRSRGDARAPLKPASATIRPAHSMERILEGNLARFEVPDLLTFLNMGRRTGVLVLEKAEQETKLFLQDGRPVFATANRDDLRLGSMLVRLGKVKAAELDKILQQQGPGFRVGQVLLSNRVLTEEELASFLKVQVSEVIFDTFSWHDGMFTFYDKVPPPATAVTLHMDLQNLIMEGVRRIDERSRLADVFPDLNMTVEAVANPERVKQSVTLTREEWQIFFLVDGRRSLSEICRLAGDPDELASLQILYNLVQAKFVAVAAPLPEAPQAEADAAKAAPAAPAPAAGPAGTQRASVELRPPAAAAAPEPAAAPFSVELSSAIVQRRLEDDTKEVVNKEAVQYLGKATKLIVSRLTLLKDGNETSFPLTRDTQTLGRHRNNDIVINDPKCSSFHARIDRTQEGFTVIDLKSRNGTYVNGKRIDELRLKTGDEVRVGTARLTYKVDYTSSVS